MDTKYNIEFTFAFSNECILFDKVNDWIKGFMEWLSKNGHTVSFSKYYFTTVDGIRINRSLSACTIYTDLLSDYTRYLDEYSK